MRISRIVQAFVVLIALAGFASTARAESGRIQFEVFKGGWFIGGAGGSGVLFFRGRAYPISIGGISAGLVFGASVTRFSGRVHNIRSPYDVVGAYGAIGAGGAVIVGAQFIRLRNEKGALLTLQGKQIGLIANVDLSGLAISMR